jgi:4-amino-4-deoxy-L-arabinose transferase-like glycosyltransferase
MLSQNSKLWIVVTVACVFFLRLSTFHTPILDADEAVFGTFASSVLHGGVPYLDAADIKPPLVFFIYYLNWLVFGENNMIAMHVFTAVWIIITAVIVGMIGKRLANREVGNMAMILYAIGTSLGEPKLLASNINILMAFPLSLGFYFFILADSKDKGWLWMTSGLMCAVASLFRYQGGIMLIVVMICTLINKNPFRLKFKHLLLIATGAAFAYGVMYAYLLSIGAANDAIFWSLTYGLVYASKGEVFAFWPRFLFKTSLFVLATLPLFVAAAMLMMRTLRERNNLRQFGYLIIWFLLTWWPVCMGRRFYSHYYLMLIPPLSIMAGWGLSYMKSAKAKHVFAFAVAFWALVFFVIHIDSMGLREKLGIHPSDWEEISLLQCPVGQYIKERTNPSDRIFIWGFAAPIYYCAERLPSSRFISADALIGRTSGGTRYKLNVGSKSLSETEKGLWKTLFSDFAKNPPVYVVDVSQSEFGAYKDYPLESYPIHEWLAAQGYRFESIVSGAKLYHR